MVEKPVWTMVTSKISGKWISHKKGQWERMYTASETHIRNYHRIGGLKEKYILSQYRRPEVWNQNVAGLVQLCRL